MDGAGLQRALLAMMIVLFALVVFSTLRELDREASCAVGGPLPSGIMALDGGAKQ